MKCVLLLTIIVLMLFAGSTMAFDALTSGGVGFMVQSGQSTELGYYAGFNIPIVTKVESGFVYKSETGYFYADQGPQEVQALRVMVIVEKTLKASTEIKADKTSYEYFKWFFGAGSGTWAFTKVGTTANPDGNDEMYGALNFRTGLFWRGVNFITQVDIVQLPGPDMIVPMVGFAFAF